MELLVRAVSQLDILAREARATGDQGSYDTLITAQNIVLHGILVSAKYKAVKVATIERQRPKLKIVD